MVKVVVVIRCCTVNRLQVNPCLVVRVHPCAIYGFEDFAFANELEVEGATDTCYIFGWEASYGTRYIHMYIAGSLDNLLEIEIKDFGSGLTWDEWKEAINLFIVTF